MALGLYRYIYLDNSHISKSGFTRLLGNDNIIVCNVLRVVLLVTYICVIVIVNVIFVVVVIVVVTVIVVVIIYGPSLCQNQQ